MHVQRGLFVSAGWLSVRLSVPLSTHEFLHSPKHGITGPIQAILILLNILYSEGMTWLFNPSSNLFAFPQITYNENKINALPLNVI